MQLRLATEERAQAVGGRLTQAGGRAGGVQRQRRAERTGPRPVRDVDSGGCDGCIVGGSPREHRRHRPIVLARLFLVVHEMAPGPVGAEAHRVKRAAQFRLVFGVARQTPEFGYAVSELTLVSVFTDAEFLVGPA